MSFEQFPSPESTVTSLLATSGHLRSSLRSEPVLAFRYRDRDFESATEALDAYIADFERSEPKTSSARLQLSTNQTASPFPVRSTIRNKDVLHEQLTDRELDFLTLPVGVQHRETDCLSVTTNDLLVLPSDGSLPITRTSAFLSLTGGPSGSYSRGQHVYSTTSNHQRPKPSNRHTPCVHHSTSRNLLLPSVPGGKPSEISTGLGMRSRQRSRHHGLNYMSERDLADRASPHHYPRWLTSQKSEMDFSGITSVPDMEYPTWLQECGVPTDPTTMKFPRTNTQTGGQTLPLTPKLPYWLGELEASYEELQKDSGGHLGALRDSSDLRRDPAANEANDMTLRQLRLQFAEQLAQAVESDRDLDNAFRDDKIECLILKAEKALSSPSLGLSCPQQQDMDATDATDDGLEADRSWDNPAVTFKSPVPVGGAEEPDIAKEPQYDRNGKAMESCSVGYSSRKPPGPVEALKQMLFSLQAVEQQISQEEQPSADQTPDTATLVNTQDRGADRNGEKPTKTTRMTGTELDSFDTAPGGQSLQRALHHLGRLKSLVEDQKEKTTLEGKAS